MKKEKTDLEKLKELGDRVRYGDVREAIGKDRYDLEDYSSPPPQKCVFCNAPWTAEMHKLMEESGYCETCYWSETIIYIACSKCERVVYAK